MFKKEMKFGYSAGDNQIVKPSIFTNIRLTPKNKKFIFNGTRQDILKWMTSHPELLVEYDPSDQDNEASFSLPSSPLFSNYPEAPEILLSPISITSTLSTDSTDSTNSTDSTSSIGKKQRDITFDLFAISEDSSFYKPLNIALKVVPWIEVTLEIRPTDEHKDSKLYPIHRVILPSGLSLYEISKALEKSWKSLTADQTAFSSDDFVRNSESQKKFDPDSDVEYDKHSNKFMSEIAKRVPTVDSWLRQKQNSDDDLPPGMLTPYIIEDVLRELDENKEENFVNERIPLDKKKEAELEKGPSMDDLPKYETAFGRFKKNFR